MNSSNTIRATAEWHGTLPDWVATLAHECDASSQKDTAARCGYSTAVINQVLGNRYAGDLTAVEMAVKGALMHEEIICPVMGEMPLHTCLENQRRKFSPTNSTRARLWRACRTACSHSRVAKKES